ncbi:MAG: EAL domain-containing protein, partial [Clostridia bacterium]|nr:EAL domain-containing protein [Clostridia bacterium]
VPEELSRLCERYGVAPSKLKIEITEKALFDGEDRESDVVDRLHAAGFTVAIDDFGKGYSSLSILKDVRVDTLKIDMGFIQGESNLDRSMIIIRSIVTMAEALGMKVIIEGVETDDQLKMLEAVGCRNFQGYYFSHPVPVCDFEAFAASRLA